MADNFFSSNHKTLIKNLIFTLSIFIFWSFLSIISVLAQPLNVPNPAFRIFSELDNLAISLVGEIIASYLSPFVILNMLLLLLSIGLSSLLRMGLYRQVTTVKKGTANSQKSILHANSSKSIKLENVIKSHLDVVSGFEKAFVASATIEIPAKTAVILEMRNKEKKVIPGEVIDTPFQYRLERGAAITGLFPLGKQKMRIIIESVTTSGKNASEEWTFQCGFPMKETEGRNTFDTDALLAAVRDGDYSLWKNLVHMSLLSSLTSCGFQITRGYTHNPDFFHLLKPKDTENQTVWNQESRRKKFRSHKRMYIIPFCDISIFRDLFIHRNRKFTLSKPFRQVNKLLLNTQENTNLFDEIFNSSLQRNFRLNFSTTLRKLYDYPVAEIEIIRNYQ